jgi:hypothetical protein
MVETFEYKIGIDERLAPVSKIDDIFEEMTETALDLGFEKVLKHLNGRKLKVGTMCSGTESPILALELVAKCKFWMLVFQACRLTLYSSKEAWSVAGDRSAVRSRDCGF